MATACRPPSGNWQSLIVRPVVAWTIVCALVQVGRVAAAPVWHETFDGPHPAWNVLEPDQRDQIIRHQQVHDNQRPGSKVEEIAVATAGGSSLSLSVTVGRAPVIDETRIRIWLKSNRPGVHLASRVVLPRARDPESGAPRSVLVRGPRYEAVGRWQQLDMSHLPKEVARRVRALRLELGTDVDAHEAYIDRVVLVVPGGPAGTAVRTDDLTLDGLLLETPQQPTVPSATQGRVEFESGAVFFDSASAESAFAKKLDGIVQAGWNDTVRPPQPAGFQPRAPKIRMHGPTLTVDEQPFLCRAVVGYGEPIEELAQLGFNTILLPELPTAKHIQEAQQHQIWLLSPPPSADQLADANLPVADAYRRVLGWYLDAELFRLPSAQFRHWIEKIRQWDATQYRPILAAPGTSQRPAANRADVFIFGRFVAVGCTADQQDVLAEYAGWLKRRAASVAPGAPPWVRIQLAPQPPAQQQAAALLGATRASPMISGIDERQIETITRLAIGEGFRGVIVDSGGSLAGADASTNRRASALALLNLQLELIEPWITGGKVIGLATSSRDDLIAAVLQVERARLVVPIKVGRAQVSRQHDAASEDPPQTSRGLSSTAAHYSFTVPGVPESSRVFLLNLAELTPLSHRRVAGGIHVTLDRRDEGFVLLTDDPQAISSMRKKVASMAGRAVRLQRELARARLTAVSPWMGVSASRTEATSERPQSPGEFYLDRARESISQCDAQLAEGNAATAYQNATVALQHIDEAIHHVTRRWTGEGQAILTSSPILATLDTLPNLANFRAKAASLPASGNLLYGGDFENLDLLLEFGWKHIRSAHPAVRSHVELSTDRPHHGRYCLSLTTSPETPDQSTSDITEPLVWVTSPQVPVSAEQMVEITGWVRVDEPLADGIAGLQIVDSLGGPDLCLRVRQTSGWQPFRMIRYASRPTKLDLTFVLSGLGTAHIDAVMVRPIGGAATND